MHSYKCLKKKFKELNIVLIVQCNQCNRFDSILYEQVVNYLHNFVCTTVDKVKTIWNNLRNARTRYIKSDKTTIKMDTWKWAKQLQFLSIVEVSQRYFEYLFKKKQLSIFFASIKFYFCFVNDFHSRYMDQSW